MDGQNHIQNLKVPFLLLGLSIMLSALIFGFFFYQSRITRDYVDVVGSAAERFESDIVKWNITFEENTGLENIGEGYRKIQDKKRPVDEDFEQSGNSRRGDQYQPD